VILVQHNVAYHKTSLGYNTYLLDFKSINSPETQLRSMNFQ